MQSTSKCGDSLTLNTDKNVINSQSLNIRDFVTPKN
jgi:hypothetical protein